jgi:cytochrome c
MDMSGNISTTAFKGVIVLAMFSLAPAMAAPPPITGDAVKGKAVFMQCMACHTAEVGQNRLGPSLAGVVGRKSGSLAGYTYTPAMQGSNLTWTPATLDKYLTNPRAMVPGTKMIFAGLPNPDDRANVIAFLVTKTDPAK